MVCTTRTGAATAAGSLSYATYVIAATLEVENQRAALYYAGDREGRDYPEPAIYLKPDLTAAFAARLGIDRSRPLTLTEVAHLMNNHTASGGEIEGKVKHSPHQSVASVFGLDPKALPTVAEIENVLAGRRGDGATPREEKQVPRSPMDELGQAVHRGEVAYSDALNGLVRDEISRLPAGAAFDIEGIKQRVGRDLADAADRADVAASGQAPEGRPLSEQRIASALRQFRTAIGVPDGRDATPEEIQRVADGRIDVVDYRNKITATAPPVGFVDLTFSADKSVSICYALAPTEAERAIILSAVHAATDDAMAYAENVLGVARRGAGGLGEAQPAELAHIGFQHYTSRPATDIVRLDAQGREYTDTRSVPGGMSDVNLHQHRIVMSSVMTKDGHVGSLDLSRLRGEVKVLGAVFHAGIATRLRRFGIDVTLGPSGEARIGDLPEWVRKFHSRRTIQGEESAREWARSQGVDWDRLGGDQQAALIAAGVAKERQRKPYQDKRQHDEGPSEIKVWQQETEQAGYHHRSVLRPGRDAPQLTHEQRIEVARDASLDLLEAAFKTRAVLTAGDVREIAARGLVVSGLGPDASADINDVTATFRERGVRVDGAWTELLWGTDIGEDGRKQIVVTTGKAFDREEGLVEMVRSAAADRATALTAEQIDQAATRFLATHPHVDPDGAQWKAQRAMAQRIGEGGRVSLSIGVAGSGKTSAVIATLVDAWHEDGRTVYGMTVPWKASAALEEVGVDHAVAIEAFLKRVERGQYTIDAKTVIVADEVSQIGIRHQTELLKLVGRTGAQLVEIGDPRQCQAVETPAINLMAKAIGDDATPKLLSTIRQRTERGREVATMFREGRAADGIAAMHEDGSFHLVAGRQERVVERAVELWRKLTDANAEDRDYSLLVMTPTNAQARQIGMAIRQHRRDAGELDAAETMLKATDPNSGETFSLAVSIGDKLRMFSRVYDADTGGRKRWLASNGDIVEVTAVQPEGLRVRNADGVEGRVTWAQMRPWRAPRNDPVMVTYGYAVTIDAAQSLTKSEGIVVMPDGSGQVTGYKAYTGMSRHIADAHMVVSDAAERRQIVKRQMLGLNQTPSEADVVRNIAENLSRFPAKSQATEAIQRATNVRRGMIGERRMAAAVEPKEEQGREYKPSLYERLQLSRTVERIIEYTHELRRSWQREHEIERLTHRHRQTRGHSLGL